MPDPTSRPDLVGFAGSLELTAAPFRHRPRLKWPLPSSSSLAVYWLDRRLEPKGSLTLEHRYLPEFRGPEAPPVRDAERTRQHDPTDGRRTR